MLTIIARNISFDSPLGYNERTADGIPCEPSRPGVRHGWDRRLRAVDASYLGGTTEGGVRQARSAIALGLLILRAQRRDGIPAAEFPPHTCADHPRPLCNRTICNVCGVTIG